MKATQSMHRNIVTMLMILFSGDLGYQATAGTTVVSWENLCNGWTTNTPAGLSNLVSISVGNSHVLGLTSEGSVVAWGKGSYNTTNVPVGLSNVVEIAAGEYYSLALKGDGTVVSWGGDGWPFGPPPLPAGLSNVVQIGVGVAYGIALKCDGAVVVWGNPEMDNTPTNAPPGLSNVVAIARGIAFQALVLKEDGITFGWAGPGPGDPPPGLSNVVAVALGPNLNVALKSDGIAAAWPWVTAYPAGATNIMAIAGGNGSAYAIRTDGTIYDWGYDSGPPPYPKPAQFPPPPGLSNVVMMSGGAFCNPKALQDDDLPGDGSPYVFQNPFHRTSNPGSAALFNIGAIGLPRLCYQWRFNGTNIHGATNSWFVVTDVSAADVGHYQCIVSNSIGVTVSAPATLTVPGALQFDASATMLGVGGLNLRLMGLSAQGDVIIHASSNLLNWEPILTNPPVLGAFDLVDPAATNLPFRFYRAEER